MEREPQITGPDFPIERGGPGQPPPYAGRLARAGPLAPQTRSDLMREGGELELEPAMWVPEHDYQPSEDRSVIRMLRMSPGVQSYDDFITEPTVPPSWNIRVGPGRAIVDGSVNPWLQGSYVVYSPAWKEIPVEPAHPTLERLDVVCIHVLDQENSTEMGFGWRREVQTGEPGSGLPPELPPNCLPLRGLRIPAGATALQTSHLVNIWPPWHNADFRRPASLILSHVLDYHEGRAVGQGAPGYQPFSFPYDQLGQVPGGTPTPGIEAWRELALWPFPVLMEFHWVGHLEAGVTGITSMQTTNVDCYSRGKAAYDNTSLPTRQRGRMIRHNMCFNPGQHVRTFTTTFQMLEVFEPGEVPKAEVVISPESAVDFKASYEVKIYPLQSTDHRLWVGPVDF